MLTKWDFQKSLLLYSSPKTTFSHVPSDHQLLSQYYSRDYPTWSWGSSYSYLTFLTQIFFWLFPHPLVFLTSLDLCAPFQSLITMLPLVKGLALAVSQEFILNGFIILLFLLFLNDFVNTHAAFSPAYLTPGSSNIPLDFLQSPF